MSDSVNVTAFENGPFKVSNAKSLRYCGKPVDIDGDVYLCRCGKSANAPFCDGTHNKVGFDSSAAETPKKDIRVWEGNTLRTRFNPNACMHVFYCKPLKELRERELAGDADAAAEIMRVVGTCPSGALSYETKTELPAPALEAGADIEVVEGGEIRVQCAFDINAELFEGQPSDRATLCRCGLSKSKPWCDGRHKARKDFR